MILNAKISILFPIEKIIREIALACEGKCKIFAVYDLYREEIEQREDLAK